MKPPLRRWLYWLPRALAVLFALFLGLFALDVFQEQHGFRETALALIKHLIPTWLVLGVLAVSWRREWVGAVLYVALASCYAWIAVNRGHPEWSLVISGPLVVLSGLFLANWIYRNEIRAVA